MITFSSISLSFGGQHIFKNLTWFVRSNKRIGLIGTNGAGKTTASFTILPEILDCKEFVNADEIAKGLSPFQPEKVAFESGRIMLNRIDELFSQNENFAFETTLATKTYKQKILKELDFIQPLKWLLVIIAIAGSIKFVLQLGSTIPAVSQLAFGFRSIVIAYLHLVLLAFISLFLVTYAYMTKLSIFNKYSFAGIAIFVVGILLNELLLGIQGIASIGYILIPYINESLFFVSLLLMSGIGIIVMSQLALPSKSN